MELTIAVASLGDTTETFLGHQSKRIRSNNLEFLIGGQGQNDDGTFTIKSIEIIHWGILQSFEEGVHFLLEVQVGCQMPTN